jgi:hypothetical protein
MRGERRLPMLLLAAALAATASAPSLAVAGALKSSPRCPRTTGYYAWQGGTPPRPRKLAELPPANLYSAVYRTIGGCEAPIIVKYGVGR